MPSPSPLRHAPSLAQHRFVALMAIWFVGSSVWGAFVWKTTGYSLPFLFAAGVLAFVGIQLPIQNWLVAWVGRLATPVWFDFFVTALIASAVYGVLHVLIFTLPFAWLGSVSFWISHFLDDFASWWPSEAMMLSAWFAAWWMVFRLGWLRVSTGLIAAGLQYTIIKAVVLVHVEPKDWLLLAPVHFFAGWSLLFLPGAVASHDCVPAQRGPRLLLKQILGSTVPGVAALWPLFRFAWFHE